MQMQGLMPSVLIGKLKQHLSPFVSPDTDLFQAMFLVHRLPSMCETVGAGIHMTAAAMVKALPTPLVDSQTSWVYPINPVQYLYISCYVTANKPVLL